MKQVFSALKGKTYPEDSLVACSSRVTKRNWLLPSMTLFVAVVVSQDRNYDLSVFLQCPVRLVLDRFIPRRTT